MKLQKILLMVAVFAMLQTGGFAQTVLYSGGTITETFDGMGPAGTNTPPGWFVGSNTSATAISYTTNLSLNDGTIGINANVRGWNVGSAGSADRALGVSPTLTNRYIEVRILNATRMSISAIDLHYDGEQWRTGNNAATTNINSFQFSADGVNYANMGTAFRFVQPVVAATPVALNGNDSANRVPNIGGSYMLPASAGPNSTIYLRWVDINDPNSDPLMAMDNFTFSATLVTEPVTLGITSPTNNQAIPLTGTIAATTFSAGTIEGVGFYVDGNLVSNDFVPPFTASISTAGLSLGNHTIVAVATNENGVAVPATNSVAVQIVANQSPSIIFSNSFSGFATGTVFLVGSAITNSVVATDDVAITNIDFFVDDSRILSRATATSAVITNFIYIDALAGVHQFKVVAYDNAGLTGTVIRNITITNPPANFSLLIQNGSGWKYLAGATAPGLDGNDRLWYQPGFDDSNWGMGVGELGNGDVADGYPERTPIDIGPTGSRYRTIYFRNTFSVDDPSRYTNMVLSILFDDGCVVWLNGLPISTNNISNVASGISYTNAANPAPNDGTAYLVNSIGSEGLLSSGLNTIAVEVHQQNSTSSDLSFDLMLWAQGGERPRLSVAFFEQSVSVSWQGSGYTLQQNSDLGNSNGWTPVAGNPQNSYQFAPAANQSPLFFRLMK
jgi:hypothetical protein